MRLAFITRTSSHIVSLALGCSFLPGCSSSSADGLGATPGGSQDEALAGEKIANGMVPNTEDITVEGKLASHDLPLDAPSCEKTLCINSAYAVAPTLDSTESAVFVQLGFASGIDEESFTRDPLNLSVVVDRSGSMAGEKIEAVRVALSHLLDQLGERDRLSVVLFDDRVDVLLASTMVTDKEQLSGLFSDIRERGSTNLSAGLSEGFTQVEAYAGEPGVSDRVIVLTDAIVNTGATDTASFIDQANAAAAENIGLTVFGVGTDLNQELVVAVSKLRGGNYYYLADYATISEVFDRDFDYLVTPLAYDLAFKLTPSPGFRVRSVYGFPSWTTASSTVDIEVPTVFLSRGHGAIVARLERDGSWPEGETPLASLSLSYESAGGDATETASEAASEVETFESVYDEAEPLSDESLFYSQPGARRTVAYVNSALGQREACALYWDGNGEDAAELLDRTESLLREEASALDDDELAEEAELVARLGSNVGNGSNGYGHGTGDDDYDDEGHYPSCSLRGGEATAHGTLGAAFGALVLGAALARRRRRLESRRCSDFDHMLAK